MSEAVKFGWSRRGMLGGVAAAGMLGLSGCASMGGFSFTEAVRRLLQLSTENAFALLTAPGGFWDRQVARLALPDVFGGRGGIAQSLLTSAAFRERLQHQLNIAAEAGARRAAPIVAETVRAISIPAALELLRGGPSAATDFLRGNMGSSLAEAMVPALGDGIRLASDPVVGQALKALSGVDVTGVARGFSAQVDNAIWGEVGRQEAQIRAHPESTRDPLLIAAFKLL